MISTTNIATTKRSARTTQTTEARTDEIRGYHMERVGKVLGGIVVAGLVFASCLQFSMESAEYATTTSNPVQEWIESNREQFDASVADLEEFDRLVTSFVAATNSFAEASYDPDATVRDFEDAVLDIHRTGAALRVALADRPTSGSPEWFDLGIAVFDMEHGYDDALAAIHSEDLHAYDSAISRINVARAEMLRLASVAADG